MFSLDRNDSTDSEWRKSHLPATLNIESHISFIQVPILARCFVSVVIPVRDEAENLSKTLKSFLAQTDFQNFPLDSDIFEIIILANNCRDNSAEIIEKWQRENPTFNLYSAEMKLPAENANVGFARRLLMNEAFHRLKSNKFGGGIIATTDGDTRVAFDWIANILSEIENGSDAVGGRILIDEKEFELLDEKTRNFHLLDEEYRLLSAEVEDFYDDLPHDPVPRHHQHFNGSFAVTTEAFERAGGVPDVKFLEDVAFYNALLRIDAKVRHSPAVKVFTSARSCGRTALGLSTQLSEWKIMGKNDDQYLVESAQSIEKRFTTRRKLRELWQKAITKSFIEAVEISLIAEQLQISNTNLSKALKGSQTFGSFMEKISEEQNAADVWKQNNALVPVERAIHDLRIKLAELRSAGKSRIKTV